jgi:hypothetical protein
VLEFEWIATYFGCLRARIILKHLLGMPKWIRPSMNRNIRMFFVQTSTLPPSMHRKRADNGRCCMQNNQLSIKSPIEVDDNSNVVMMRASTLLLSYWFSWMLGVCSHSEYFMGASQPLYQKHWPAWELNSQPRPELQELIWLSPIC